MRAIVFVLCLAPLCARAQLVPVPTPALGAQCDDLDPAQLAGTVEKHIAALGRSPITFNLGGKTVTGPAYVESTLKPLLKLAQQGLPALCKGLQTRFQFLRNAGVGEGKFTAYHNPLLLGSRTRQGPYQFPLLRRPPGELAKLTTEQILKGGLDGKNLELIWLADATEVQAAHVEGSATIQLPDGSTMNVGSDGHNGYPYQNVGKLLLADNKIPKNQQTPIGMTRARKYFIDNPSELNVYWAKNPHYVFFKESNKRGGGKFGELVPGRSIAVDASMVTLGLAVWIRTDKPAIAGNKVQQWISYGRVVFADDTGAGIKGAGRVDVFFGTGEYAQQASAVTTRPGEIYALVAK